MVVAGKMRLFGEGRRKYSYKLKWITEQPQAVPRCTPIIL
jgi:hypothetical protein